MKNDNEKWGIRWDFSLSVFFFFQGNGITMGKILLVANARICNSQSQRKSVVLDHKSFYAMLSISDHHLLNVAKLAINTNPLFATYRETNLCQNVYSLACWYNFSHQPLLVKDLSICHSIIIHFLKTDSLRIVSLDFCKKRKHEHTNNRVENRIVEVIFVVGRMSILWQLSAKGTVIW